MSLPSTIFDIDQQAVVTRQRLFHNVLRTGDVMVVSRSTYLGKIETLLKEAQKYDLHIADVPANCYSILPVIPLSDVELLTVCREYCFASSESARASIRSALYLKDYPLFRNSIHNKIALFHPSDSIVRILHLCYTVCQATKPEQESIFEQSPYLNASPVRQICRYLMVDVEHKQAYARTADDANRNSHTGFHVDAPQHQSPLTAQATTEYEAYATEHDLYDVQTANELAPRNNSNDDNHSKNHHSTTISTQDDTMRIHPVSIHYSNIYDNNDMEALEKEDLTGQEIVDEVNTISCEYPDEKDYEVIRQSSVHHDSYDGERRLAAIYLRRAIPHELCQRAAAALTGAATRKNMRSRTNGGREPPETGIVGYYDYLNNPTPFKFRETAYMRSNRDLIKDGCADFLHALDAIYRHEAPQHYQLQKAAIPDQFQLFHTVFSTITVNRNFRTAIHTDRGDFRSGLGALIVVSGEFEGCHLAIKRLHKAFELRVGDVLLFDTSLEHGNTPLQTCDSACVRVSLVCYFRTGLISWMYAMERKTHLNLLVHERLSRLGQSHQKSAQKDVCIMSSMNNSNDDNNTVSNREVDCSSANNEKDRVTSSQSQPAGLSIPPELARQLTMVQLTALRFAIERTVRECGCVIAMTMGLGKTLVALTLSYLYSQAYPDRDILIVTPKPTMMHWCNEYVKWKLYGLDFRHFIVGGATTSSFQSMKHMISNSHGGYSDCAASGNVLEKRDGRVFVVNPECMPAFRRSNRSFDPILVIVDEGHRMASKTSQLTCHLNRLRCRRRVVLSGTPIQNDADELYNLVSWVNENVSHVLSLSRFNKLMSDVQTYINSEEQEEEGGNSPSSSGELFHRAMSSLAYIHEWMNGFVFREMACDLPPLHDYLLICGNSTAQHNITHSHYFARGTTNSSLHSDLMVPGESGGKLLSAAEHWPYHLSAHPLCYLAFISGAYGSMTGSHSRKDSSAYHNSLHKSGARRHLSDDELSLVEHCYMNIHNSNLDGFLLLSGKLTVLIHIMKMIAACDEKAIIFSQYVGAQDIIHRTLTAFELSAFTVRGRDALSRRQLAMDQFRRSRDLRALVLSTKLAAYGLDFTAANHVILFDSWWNPQVDAQAIARAYRCNQTKPVWVYRLGSAFEDQRIFKVQTRKMALFNCVMHERASRVAHAGEVVDCAESDDNASSHALWKKLKKTYLTGGYPALVNVYRYRDTVKEKAIANNTENTS